MGTSTQAVIESGAPEVPLEGDPARGGIYRLLANLLYRPPATELLAALRGMAPGAEGALAEPLQMLRLASERASAEAVDEEYHALFIGVGRGELMPYGSWYLTGFLMDRPLAVLRRDLAALGIERDEHVSEPEDHVAALCEAMALLSEDPSMEPARERRFFAEHLEPWMGVFFSDLQTAQSACFYRAVGRLGERFLDFERKYLTMPA